MPKRLSLEARQVAEAWDALRKAHPEADCFRIELWPKWPTGWMRARCGAYYSSRSFVEAVGPDFPSAQAKLPGHA